MSWITDVTHSRWCVVYGLQYGLASSQKAKAAVMDAMQADAAKHPAIEKLYQLLTGREATVLKERPTEEAEEGGSGGSVGPRLQRLDLPSYYFEDERAPHLRVKPTVPEGTRRVTYETHDELVLPPTAEHNRQDALKPMSEFPKWAQSAFPGVKELNPMQSKVYACALRAMRICSSPP
ncbi:ATP-dependent RNA helicase, partial [Angomonas deanei]